MARCSTARSSAASRPRLRSATSSSAGPKACRRSRSVARSASCARPTSPMAIADHRLPSSPARPWCSKSSCSKSSNSKDSHAPRWGPRLELGMALGCFGRPKHRFVVRLRSMVGHAQRLVLGVVPGFCGALVEARAAAALHHGVVGALDAEPALLDQCGRGPASRLDIVRGRLGIENPEFHGCSCNQKIPCFAILKKYPLQCEAGAKQKMEIGRASCRERV